MSNTIEIQKSSNLITLFFSFPILLVSLFLSLFDVANASAGDDSFLLDDCSEGGCNDGGGVDP